MHLDALLADQPLPAGSSRGWATRICARSPSSASRPRPSPASSTSSTGSPFPIAGRRARSCSTRPTPTRLLTRIRRQWFAKRKSITAILKEVMTNEASVLVDTDAANKAADADLALQELGSDDVGQAYVTATVTVWDEDRRRRRREAAAGREDHPGPRLHLHRRDASTRSKPGSASLPGHVYANVRQPPVSTLNLAHMIPLSAVWAGPERDEHFDAPPLALRQDRGLDPVPVLASCRRRRPHAGRRPDRRRQVRAAGADGAAVPALSAAQVFAFDFGGSIRAAALAMGGDWHDLGGALAGRRGRHPSRCSRSPASITRRSAPGPPNGSSTILAREGVAVTPEVKEHLWSALTSLASRAGRRAHAHRPRRAAAVQRR